ncbi:MAG: penicillin acylase family protein [Deltaproteobacteria bacterium]|nr:penicillin acylase family protein [Deltaproteobacteria bacterium]
MRVGLICLLVGLLASWGCTSSSSSAGAAGSGGNGGGAGTGGTPAPMWPPDATVYFDQYGIFHADCETDEGCAMALGYFHARDRFVQMDLQRRLSTGRLASVVNKAVVESAGLLEPLINTATANRALYSTRNGTPVEEALVDGTDEGTLRLFQAYAVGVNQWLDDVRNERNGAIWPAEFESILLDYDPEDAPDWTPKDSFATVLTLVGSLTNDEGTQLAAEQARQQIGDNDRYLDLWSLEPIKKSPVLEVGTYPPQMASNTASKMKKSARHAIYRRAQKAIAAQRAELESSKGIRKLFPTAESVGADIGSNNWVLGPSKTANGRTFLSNDPHLGLSQPAVWYLAHLDSKTNGNGTLHTAGVTLAGIPTPVIGHNETIAWGATNTGLDFTDVYLEELAKNAEGEPIGVIFNGEVVEFIRVDFTLDFTDGSSETREILFVPHHGPVRQIDAENNVALTLRWTGHDIDTDANYLLGMATATSVQEARSALESVTSLGQNWVVIDTQGNFGWFPYNRIPKRTWAENLDMEDPNEPFPWLPLPGSTDAYEWGQYFDYSELPQTFNRENGFLITANSDHTGAAFDGNPTNDGFAPQQTDNIAAGYRTARIVELIEATDEHTRATNEAAISDVVSMIGRDMVPPILAIANDPQTNLTANGQKIVNALTDWGFTCETGLTGNDPVNSPLASAEEVKESSGCTAWHEVLRDIDEALARDENTKSFPSFVTYFSIMDTSRLKAGDVYWDDVTTEGVVETKYDIIGKAFNESGDTLVGQFGEDETAWPWGKKHGFRLEALLASLSSFFNVYNNPSGDEDFFANRGGRLTVDVANSGSDGLHGSGPSTRFQCEGTEPIQCTVQLPGGQSSHASSDNYEDLLQLWLSRTPVELVFDIEQAKSEAVETFDLGNRGE